VAKAMTRPRIESRKISFQFMVLVPFFGEGVLGNYIAFWNENGRRTEGPPQGMASPHFVSEDGCAEVIDVVGD